MKNLILIILLLSSSITYCQEFIFSDTIDLNFDGVPEIISLDRLDENNEFTLRISDKKIKGNFYDRSIDTDGFTIIDINTNDKFKEVVVYSPGPSNDDEYVIYWYNGEEIIFMEHLSRWPTFNGNGIVYLDKWEGFWSSRDKYHLDKNRNLNLIEQFAYYVGRNIKLKTGFVIYREKELVNKVALLRGDSEISIILCEKHEKDFFDYKYLIKSESGLLGWTNFRQIYENAEELNMAD